MRSWSWSLDDPRPGEIQVQLAASGVCHSDDHLATGDLSAGIYPFAGGHEGAGTVVAIGPGTTGFAEGDHVVLAVPGCGHCAWCAQGQQNLCDLGQYTLAGCRFDDPPSYGSASTASRSARCAGSRHSASTRPSRPRRRCAFLPTYRWTWPRSSAAAWPPAGDRQSCRPSARWSSTGGGLGDRRGGRHPGRARRYALADVAHGYTDMRTGKNIRGIIDYTSEGG